MLSTCHRNHLLLDARTCIPNNKAKLDKSVKKKIYWPSKPLLTISTQQLSSAQNLYISVSFRDKKRNYHKSYKKAEDAEKWTKVVNIPPGDQDIHTKHTTDQIQRDKN
jgi:hypothetical protein